MYREDIEKIFKEDIRDKKKAGNGVFSRRGHGVKHGISGALRTSSYYMTNKEKKKLSGEVTVSNMYETILTRTEFELKDRDTQKAMLTRWRELFPNQKIMDEMAKDGSRSFNTQSFADLVNGLGCPPKIRGGSQPRKERQAKVKAKSKAVAIQPSWNGTQTNMLEFVEPEVKFVQAIPEPTNGLNLTYNGEYTAEQLVKLFTKLQLITEGEENKFKLAINLIELA
jgi:hypothetical protein